MRGGNWASSGAVMPAQATEAALQRTATSQASGTLPTVNDDEVIGETCDRLGIRVVLLARLWQEKILLKHVELSGLADVVLGAVTTAEHAEVDPVHDARTRYFARGVGPSRWLLIVVSYEQAPARIVSAFAYRKDPPTWKT